jgi:hypothetical protein
MCFFLNFKLRYPCANWFGVFVVGFGVFTMRKISYGVSGLSSGINLCGENFSWNDVWGFDHIDVALILADRH